MYDEVARKSWSDRAYSNDSSLKLEDEADKVCPNLLEKAVAKYNTVIEKAVLLLLNIFDWVCASINFCMQGCC